MKENLLDHIVCPADGQTLALDASRCDGAEITDGFLTCGNGHRFEITGGVPCLMFDADGVPSAHQTRESFSSKWQKIPDFGIESASRDFYVDWYLQRYHYDGLAGLREFLRGKRTILDAGTGLGRDSLLYAENSDAQVFGVDISDSIFTAYRHMGRHPNLHLIQADLTNLPFPEGFFDFIASDQVLHHTPDTRASFNGLVRLLKTSGTIAAYVYKVKGPIREFCDDFLRQHYTRASAEDCYDFSRAMTRLGKALSDLNIVFDVPEDVPILDIKAGPMNLQRFIYWHVFKCYWNDDLDFETNVMTNFDWYHPTYAHRHTPEEIRSWCEAAGLRLTHMDIVDSGISFKAEKRQGTEG